MRRHAGCGDVGACINDACLPNSMNGLTYKTLDDARVAGKRVLVRADLNVPMQDGKVTDATRLRAVAPTLRELVGEGARVIVASHFGRPKGARLPEMSLAPVVSALGEAAGLPDIAFADDCVGAAASDAVAALAGGQVLVLENLRFHAGEEANDPGFAAELAGLADIYVNDAFSCAHRAHASTEGVTHHLPAYAGRALEAELTALEGALGAPERPVGAVVGGAKVSTKLDVLLNLVKRVDHLLIGGAMANTFLFAQGHDVGRSLHEPDLAETARDVMAAAADAGCALHLPADFVVAADLAAGIETQTVAADAIPADMMALDVGDQTSAAYAAAIEACRTLVWNGPLGAFEVDPFDAATRTVALVAAARTRAGQLNSVAGGGDTVAALAKAGAIDGFSYISTAGGAFLEWLEGRELPGVAALSRERVSHELAVNLRCDLADPGARFGRRLGAGCQLRLPQGAHPDREADLQRQTPAAAGRVPGPRLQRHPQRAADPRPQSALP